MWLQAIGVGEVDAEGIGDVESVGPVLGEPGRRQGPRLERGRRPGQPLLGIRRPQRRHRRPAGHPPAVEHLRGSRPLRRDHPLGEVVDRFAGPPHRVPAGRVAAAALATTASSVWARWRTTSATDHPAAADGLSHASSSSSSRIASSRSCSATRSSMISTAGRYRDARAEWSGGVGWGSVGLVGGHGVRVVGGRGGRVRRRWRAASMASAGWRPWRSDLRLCGSHSRLPLASAVIPPSVYGEAVVDVAVGDRLRRSRRGVGSGGRALGWRGAASPGRCAGGRRR